MTYFRYIYQAYDGGWGVLNVCECMSLSTFLQKIHFVYQSFSTEFHCSPAHALDSASKAKRLVRRRKNRAFYSQFVDRRRDISSFTFFISSLNNLMQKLTDVPVLCAKHLRTKRTRGIQYKGTASDLLSPEREWNGKRDVGKGDKQIKYEFFSLRLHGHWCSQMVQQVKTETNCEHVGKWIMIHSKMKFICVILFYCVPLCFRQLYLFH